RDLADGPLVIEADGLRCHGESEDSADRARVTQGLHGC
ncbi:hypothetical protein HDG40_007703, partial [Paraburkholderia sp. JPY158]|nr:hypothetical protein [Paraburkholderia atlantica]